MRLFYVTLVLLVLALPGLSFSIPNQSVDIDAAAAPFQSSASSLDRDLSSTATITPSLDILPVDGAAPTHQESDPPASTELRQDTVFSLDQVTQIAPDEKKVPGKSTVDLEPTKRIPNPADGDELLPESDDQGESSTNEESPASPQWVTIMNENFESSFPTGAWRVLDGDGTSYGEYYWDEDDYKPYQGSRSAWVANGGANGRDPQYFYYPNYAVSWMIYGPFDLRNTLDAELLFRYWNQSEMYFDWFYWAASVNGYQFYGTGVSGDSGGWRFVNFDLTNVPSLGNLLGRSEVWIAFVFISDYSIVDDGTFVDNIVLQKNSSSGTCPNQYKAEYYNNTNLSGTPVLVRCENWPINHNWGSGSPGNGVNSDNFSARWTGRATINSGVYTFVAVADDGMRVLMDGNLIIDAWRDQSPREYRKVRNINAGEHLLEVRYYDRGGGALAQFRYESGSFGIDYHLRSGFHVFKIDTQNPRISFETVMANDASSGNTTDREFVRDMVARPPYVSRNPVLVFNADYFGNNENGTPHHGAEGLTVKRGVRLPNNGTHNGTEWRRSSLSISSTKTIRIGRQQACVGPPNNACTNWIPNSDSFFNTVGGGPIFIRSGQRIGGSGSSAPCATESLPDWYCQTSFKWTAVGVTSSGRYLIVVATSEAKTMDDAASVLLAEGAVRAMKFDGGGSTQVWYKYWGGDIVSTDRKIANAMMVFVSP